MTIAINPRHVRAVAVEELRQEILKSLAALSSAGHPKVRVDAVREDLKPKGLLPLDDGGRLTSAARRRFREAKTSLLADQILVERDGVVWRARTPAPIGAANAQAKTPVAEEAEALDEQNAVMDLLKVEADRVFDERAAMRYSIMLLDETIDAVDTQVGVESRRRGEHHAAALDKHWREKVESIKEYARTGSPEMLPLHAVGLARDIVDGANWDADRPVLRGAIVGLALYKLKLDLERKRDGAQGQWDDLLRLASEGYGSTDVLFRGRRAFHSLAPGAEGLAEIKARVSKPGERA